MKKLKHFRCLSFIMTAAVALGLISEICAARTVHRPKFLRLPGRAEKFAKWGQGPIGTPGTMTVAFATEHMKLRMDFGDCGEIEPLTQTIEASGLGEERFKNELRQGFKMWQEVARISFRWVDDPNEADVVIGQSKTPDSITHARVALNVEKTDDPNVLAITKGSLCLDQDKLWTDAPNHQFRGLEKRLSLRLMAAHEAGHLLGLDHSSDHTQLMSKKSEESVRGLSHADIEGAVHLFGPVEVADGSHLFP